MGCHHYLSFMGSSTARGLPVLHCSCLTAAVDRSAACAIAQVLSVASSVQVSTAAAGTPLSAVQASQLVTQLSPMLEVVVDLTVMAVCVCVYSDC